MSGLVATFTRFEKLEVTSAYATSATGGGWTITITAKNTGSADATITMVMINGVPTTDATLKTYVTWTTPSTDPGTTPVSIPVGSPATFQFDLANNAQIGNGQATSGITLNIVLHSAAGKDYPTSVTLP
jgi:hypothetical protein